MDILLIILYGVDNFWLSCLKIAAQFLILNYLWVDKAIILSVLKHLLFDLGLLQ